MTYAHSIFLSFAFHGILALILHGKATGLSPLILSAKSTPTRVRIISSARSTQPGGIHVPSETLALPVHEAVSRPSRAFEPASEDRTSSLKARVRPSLSKADPVVASTPKPPVSDPSPATPSDQTEPATLTQGPSAPSAAAKGDSSIASAEQGDESNPSTKARYLSNPQPGYPSLSRRLREEGKVILKILIDAQGRSARALVQESSGFRRLDQSALDAVKTWTFVPEERDGHPAESWVLVPIVFRLQL